MGTRADFYIGRGEKAEWLGSIAWDGYSIDECDPKDLSTNDIEKKTESYWEHAIKAAKTETEYREAVTNFCTKRDDGTLPADGWPWPWDDSNTTDYAYAFDDGKSLVKHIGGWLECGAYHLMDEDKREEFDETEEPATFPNMRDKANVKLFGAGSGLIVLTAK